MDWVWFNKNNITDDYNNYKFLFNKSMYKISKKGNGFYKFNITLLKVNLNSKLFYIGVEGTHKKGKGDSQMLQCVYDKDVRDFKIRSINSTCYTKIWYVNLTELLIENNLDIKQYQKIRKEFMLKNPSLFL